MPVSSRVDSLLGWAAAQFNQSDTPRLDAELMLADLLGKDRIWLYTWPEHEVSDDVQAAFKQRVKRRCAGEPIAYILGEREFWGLPLRVSPASLIPRPETECLVEQVLQLDLPDRARVLDLGTGTGAIALALAHERRDWQLLAVEKGADAWALACGNRDRLNLAVDIRLGSWFEPVRDEAPFHLVVANPPYVESSSPWLQQGDVRFEPRSALVAGEDGLEDIRRILNSAAGFLHPGGYLMLEHGYLQGPAVRTLLHSAGMQRIETGLDLAGHERFSYGRRPGQVPA